MKTLIRFFGLSILFLPLVLQAVEVAGVDLPEQRGELTLHGAGLLRKGFIFKVYVGALYVEKEADVERILTKVPKRIDIHYFHKTPKKYMIRAAEETLKDNLSESEYRRFKPKMDQLHTAYRDGAKRGIASLIYRPDVGLTYQYDGETIVTIAGDDFSNAYLKVWLGNPPSSKTVKEKMLTKMKGSSDE